MSRFSVICLDMAGTTVRDDNTVTEAFAAGAGLPGAPLILDSVADLLPHLI